MKKVLTGMEMKACDTFTIHQMQIPSMVLMERAALAVTEVLLETYGREGRILVLCGSGNNGGDGFAAARLLLLEGMAADVYFGGKESSLTEDAALQKKIYENYGGKLCRNPDFSEYTVIVDALFGIGLSRPIGGALAELIRQVNESSVPVLAVDMPSGISSDTGQILGIAIKAEVTVSFAFAKRGQLLCPGAQFCGKLLVKDIGITSGAYEESYPFAFTYEKEDLRRVPKRSMRANKGTCGKVLLAGGAANMAGAVLLAAKAAYRTGCGLVQILSDEINRSILQSALPEALYLPWQQEDVFLQALVRVSAVGIGPGLGTSKDSAKLLRKFLLTWQGPLVMDADALNLLAQDAELFAYIRTGSIITPHPGEMARLSGQSIPEILQDLPGSAAAFARKYGVICVLKDARTVVTDGSRLYINSTGNSGMAVGGSGDVLTGVICGLLAQGMEPFEAAALGVCLHGMAGDRAAKLYGRCGMLPGEMTECVGEILKELS